MTQILENREAIAKICADLGVELLDVFGSATRDDFAPDSDIDVVVRFDRARGRMFARYFDLKERLEQIFQRPVDIVLEDSIRNPYFREAIERNRVHVYES